MVGTYSEETMTNVVDMKGKRFGRLTVIGRTGSMHRKAVWKCFCLCGTTKNIIGQSIRRGLIVSCGCYHRERQTVPKVHGHKDNGIVSPTYNSWRAMIGRCTHPSNNTFKFYGAKGVRVCERWLTFSGFLADMGERPVNTTLGRFGDTGNYEPSNCTWMSLAEQSEARKEKHRARLS